MGVPLFLPQGTRCDTQFLHVLVTLDWFLFVQRSGESGNDDESTGDSSQCRIGVGGERRVYFPPTLSIIEVYQEIL